ncbi:MAG TPA: DNA polymerase III subunit delta [bacterium]|nr:DNA polymerase III subunit delta [bacterium]
MPKASAPSHIYLLLGEEDLLVEQALKRLLDQLIPAEERALNLDVIRADEIELVDLITRVDTLPFFGRRRAVVVKDADAWTPPEQERLAAYLERGAPPSALILVASELDRRRKLYTAVRRLGEIQEFSRLSVRELPAWITDRVKQEGRRIAPDAVDALVASVGRSLRQLSLELEKIFASVAPDAAISRQDVEATVSRLSESTIFMLVDAIGEQRAGPALRHLDDLLREEAPPYVLFMIARQFRMLLRASALQERKAAPGLVQQSLGVPPYVARRMMEQAKNFPAAMFPRIFARLQEADRSIKTTGHPRLALEMLIAELTLPTTAVFA